MYIWQRDAWPRFRRDKDGVNTRLAAVRYEQGKLAGKLGALGFDISSSATLDAMAEAPVMS